MLSSVSSKTYHLVLRFTLIAAVAILIMITIIINSPTASAAEPAGQVTILHDTHIHGRYYNPANPNENIANLFGVANQIEKSKPNALYLANGDDIATSVISEVFRGKHITDAFNVSTVDADTYGNHDWDYGPEVLRQRIQESNFPWISANIIDTRTNDVFGKEQGAKRYIIKEINGVKVGITGLGIKGAFMDSTVTVLKPQTAMEQVIPLMKADGADIIVVTSHLSHIAAEALAETVKGIDVLVGDHSESVLHLPKQTEKNHTILSFRGCEFTYLGELTLQVNKEKIEEKITSFSYIEHAIVNEIRKPDFSPDPEVKVVMDSYMEQLNNEVIGKTTVPWETRTIVNRKKETAIGNYITDVMRSWKGSDLALINTRNISSNKRYEPGDITKRSVIDILPYTDLMVVLPVTGQQIMTALENGVSKVEISDGRFPQVSGVNFTYDYTKPVGSRIISASINGAPINLTTIYTLATSDYLASGVLGYTVFKDITPLFDPVTGPVLNTLVMNKIQQDKTISPQLEGRIIAVDVTAPETTYKLKPSPPVNGWLTEKAYFYLYSSDDLDLPPEMKTEYRMNGGQWIPYTGGVTISADSMYTIEYHSTDSTGNIEVVKSVKVNKDQMAPVTTHTLTPVPTGSAYSADVKVTLTATDVTSGIAKTEYRVNNGAWTTYSTPVSFTNNGAYVVEYRSTDVAGNLEAIKAVTFSIAKQSALDTKAPVTTVVLDPSQPGGTGGWNVTDVTITLSVIDDVSGVAKSEYRINGGSWVAYAAMFSLTNEGSYVIDYRSTDSAGNVEQAKTANINIDKTIPSTTYKFNNLPTGSNGWYNTKTYFYLFPKDTLSGVAKTEYRLDGVQWLAYTTTVALADGMFTVEYRTADAAGNVQLVPVGIVKVDKVAPTIAAKAAPASGSGSTLTITATDGTSGVASVEYRVNAGEWLPYTAPVDFTLQGMYTIEYRSTDVAGNVATTKAIMITVT
jgi:2',3'-cyclic-nucleotide 2'-phosphodiesterase (5'-nucleotidase family)